MTPPPPPPSLTIASLTVYPIKSCAGIRLDAATLTRDGLAFDRQFAVVKAATGRFISQRCTPKCVRGGWEEGGRRRERKQSPTLPPFRRLALVQPSLPADAFLDGWGAPPVGAALTLTAPGAEPLAVALDPDLPRATRAVTVWEYTGDAHDQGDEAAAWLTAFLGKEVRLVRYAAALAPRPVDAAWCGPSSRAAEVAFADGFPLLVLGAASVDAASAALGRPVDGGRFRANVVVAGGTPWAEDGWATVETGAPPTRLALVKPCSRCTVPHVNQATGVVDAADLTPALRPTRTGDALGWTALKSWKSSLFVGWNAVVEGAAARGAVATLAVGDPVSLLARRAGAPAGG